MGAVLDNDEPLLLPTLRIWLCLYGVELLLAMVMAQFLNSNITRSISPLVT